MITYTADRKLYFIPVSCDLSIRAVEFMLQEGLKNYLGCALEMYYDSTYTSFPQWGIVFEHGIVVSKGI